MPTQTSTLPHFLLAGLLLLIASQHLRGQTRADTLLLQLDTATTAEARYSALESLIHNSENLTQIAIYARQGLAEATAARSTKWTAIFQEYLGVCFANSGSLDSAKIMFDQALIVYETIHDETRLAGIYSKQSWHAKVTGEYADAAAFDLKALRIMEKRDDKAGMARACAFLAEDFGAMKKPEEALPYALRAVKLSENDDDLAYEYTTSLVVTAETYSFMEDYKNALNYYTKAYEAASKFGIKIDLMQAAFGKGQVLQSMERYEEALASYEEAKRINEEIDGPIQKQYAILLSIGEIHFKNQAYSLALPYFLEVIQWQESSGFAHNLAYVYKSTGQVYEGLGDYKNAIDYQRKHQVLNDSLMSVEKDAALNDLQVQYQTEQKEATIAAQTAQLSAQKKIQYGTLGIAGLLAALLFLVYRNARFRKRTNTKLATANADLNQKNAENELLLKEIHHRVKNNLQTISSLLNLQSASIKDASALDAVKESQNRVQSMALIHQQLYQGEDLIAIKMKDYFHTMTQALQNSFLPGSKTISFRLNMDNLELDIDTAILLGLISNELLTNSLKYAFPDGQAGTIEVGLQQMSEDTYTLQIADNGVGMDEAPPQSTGFGTRLVQMLTTQLEGTLTRNNKGGTATIIQFRSLTAA